MKLAITARGTNLRTRRREAWAAATPCGSWRAERLDERGTRWMLWRAGRVEFVATFGSLPKAQRYIDTVTAREGKQ